MSGKMRRILIIVPVYRRRLTPDEEVALDHLEHFLGHFDRCFIAPPGLAAPRSGYDVARFDGACFETVSSYSRMLLDPGFYERFAAYEYLLLYQLDCLVFSDRLRSFAERGFDYIGAPWLCSRDDPGRGFSRVGNGGFSLRRLDGVRAVFASRCGPWSLPRVLVQLVRSGDELAQMERGRRWRKRLAIAREVTRGIEWYRTHYTLNEDRFWSDRAVLFAPRFRVADVETGLAFAFEAAPRYCYDRCGGRLPFGAHGWSRWDREFWEPYLRRARP